MDCSTALAACGDKGTTSSEERLGTCERAVFETSGDATMSWSKGINALRRLRGIQASLGLPERNSLCYDDSMTLGFHWLHLVFLFFTALGRA